MKPYDITNPYSMVRNFTPGIMFYASPTRFAANNCGTRTITGQHYLNYGRQRRAERDQHRSQH